MSNQVISEAQLRRMAKKDYMNEKQLAFFKQRLLDLLDETKHDINEAKEQLAQVEREPDDNDQASAEGEYALLLRIIERKSKLLPKIAYSLKQIEADEYGFCEDTGEPIGIERLLVRPTATLSIEAKSVQEQKEKDFSDD